MSCPAFSSTLICFIRLLMNVSISCKGGAAEAVGADGAVEFDAITLGCGCAVMEAEGLGAGDV